MVAKRLISIKQEGNDVVAVVSAMGKTTDELVGLAAALSRILPPVKWTGCFRPANRFP